MEDVFYETRNALSQMFMVPTTWFESPVFIAYLIVPFIVTMIFFYMLLTRHIRIFRRSDAANWGISACLTFFTIPLIKINPSFSIAMSVIAAVMLSDRRITFWRLVLALVAGAVAWGLSIWLATFLSGLYIS